MKAVKVCQLAIALVSLFLSGCAGATSREVVLIDSFPAASGPGLILAHKQILLRGEVVIPVGRVFSAVGCTVDFGGGRLVSEGEARFVDCELRWPVDGKGAIVARGPLLLAACRAVPFGRAGHAPLVIGESRRSVSLAHVEIRDGACASIIAGIFGEVTVDKCVYSRLRASRPLFDLECGEIRLAASSFDSIQASPDSSTILRLRARNLEVLGNRFSECTFAQDGVDVVASTLRFSDNCVVGSVGAKQHGIFLNCQAHKMVIARNVFSSNQCMIAFCDSRDYAIAPSEESSPQTLPPSAAIEFSNNVLKGNGKSFPDGIDLAGGSVIATGNAFLENEFLTEIGVTRVPECRLTFAGNLVKGSRSKIVLSSRGEGEFEANSFLGCNVQKLLCADAVSYHSFLEGSNVFQGNQALFCFWIRKKSGEVLGPPPSALRTGNKFLVIMAAAVYTEFVTSGGSAGETCSEEEYY